MIANDPIQYGKPASETADKAITEAAAAMVFGALLIWLGVVIVLTAFLGWVGFGGSLGITGAWIVRKAIKDATRKAGKLVAVKGKQS